ncbi:MAG: hypothetical protein CML46_03270 [Rhodobacteraceae bacterium]|nr:hypothetical protein [Paracoccaceae bacterium]MBR25962.1 hypothetical protein [Paracoccaceae bacterium]
MVPLIFSSTPRSDRSAAALPAPHRGWRLSVTPVGDGWVGEASRPGRNGAPRALACETGAQRAGVLAALRARIDARRAGFVAARRLAEPVDIASVEEFLDALDQVDPQDGRLAMLVAHAAAPGRTLPASEIGRAGGHDGAQGASMHYGRLARDLAEAMELRPDPEHLAVDPAAALVAWIPVIAEPLPAPTCAAGARPDPIWRMHGPLAAALARLGLVGD